MQKTAVRIDKWLWASRFFKTRGLATEMVQAGHIQVNGERVKPAKQLQIGDTVQINREQEKFTVTVTALAEKRGSATIARTLYQESESSIQARAEQQAQQRFAAHHAPAPSKRPDKKSRRQIIRFQAK